MAYERCAAVPVAATGRDGEAIVWVFEGSDAREKVAQIELYRQSERMTS